MSHNLHFNSNTNQYSAVFAVDKNGLPWHKLGTMVSGAMTWEETIQKAGLDFQVEKIPLYINNRFYNPKSPDGHLKGFALPENFAIIRSDVEGEKSVLGVVGSNYTPLQNKYMFDFVDSMLETVSGAHYESAGVLGNGERVWCLARVPFDFSLGKDTHQTFLLFKSSHDGSKASTCRLTDVRVVCQNTLSLALSQRNVEAIKVKHTVNGKNKLDDIKKMWSGVQQNVTELKEKFNKLQEKKVTKEIFSSVMKNLFGTDWEDSVRKQNNAVEIARIFQANDNNAFPEQQGTAYSLLNAVTNYADHYRTSRITTDGYSEQQARAKSVLIGSGVSLKEQALESILQAVETTPTKESLVTPFIKTKSISNIMSMIN